MERPRRIMAAAAATLALAGGCSDGTPARQPTRIPSAPSSSWNTLTGEGLLCPDTPNDTQPLNTTYTINLFQCITPDTALPTKKITITTPAADGSTSIIDSAVAIPPNDENGNFGGRLIAEPGNECIVVDFQTQGSHITSGQISSC